MIMYCKECIENIDCPACKEFLSPCSNYVPGFNLSDACIEYCKAHPSSLSCMKKMIDPCINNINSNSLQF